jgi:hypothetical protein
VGVSSGKHYWEYTIQTANQRETLGILTPSAGLTNYVSSNVGGFAYFSFDGTKGNNGWTAYGASYTNGDVISVLLDMDAKTLTFWKNGVSQGQAFSGLSGTYHAAFGGGSSGFAEQATVNFGASAFAHTPPAGYMRGLGTLV